MMLIQSDVVFKYRKVSCEGCLFVLYATINDISIYPNPNNGSFTLQLNTATQADVLIYDAQGKLISATKVQPQIAQQVTLAESGMYLITVITADGQRSSQRVVVNK
jgi:membrane carboxypeptidase/penicillin-binding protein PbpC